MKLLLSLLLALPLFAFSQKDTVIIEKKVILNDDGTWNYAGEKPLPTYKEPVNDNMFRPCFGFKLGGVVAAFHNRFISNLEMGVGFEFIWHSDRRYAGGFSVSPSFVGDTYLSTSVRFINELRLTDKASITKVCVRGEFGIWSLIDFDGGNQYTGTESFSGGVIGVSVPIVFRSKSKTSFYLRPYIDNVITPYLDIDQYGYGTRTNVGYLVSPGIACGWRF